VHKPLQQIRRIKLLLAGVEQVVQVPLAQEQLVGMVLHLVHSVSPPLVVSVVNLHQEVVVLSALRRAMAVTQAAVMPVVNRTGKAAVVVPAPEVQVTTQRIKTV
jgi:hypothetical protein